MEKQNVNEAYKVSIISIIINALLMTFKSVVGFISKSSALISDGIHSGSDVFSTLVVMLGIKLSNRKDDESHPYGHERIECIVALILSGILFVVGLDIGLDGIKTLINKTYLDKEITIKSIAIIATLSSIVLKEAMYWYTRFYAKKLNSDALMADAWHHRSDAFSSIGSFAALIGVTLGYPICDPIASIIICIFIIRAAIDIFMDATNKLVDRSCDKKTIEKIRKIITNNNNVITIDEVKARLFASKIYVDVEISLDETLSLKDSHQIAQDIHDDIEKQITLVKHCMIHVNPSEMPKKKNKK